MKPIKWPQWCRSFWNEHIKEHRLSGIVTPSVCLSVFPQRLFDSLYISHFLRVQLSFFHPLPFPCSAPNGRKGCHFWKKAWEGKNLKPYSLLPLYRENFLQQKVTLISFLYFLLWWGGGRKSDFWQMWYYTTTEMEKIIENMHQYILSTFRCWHFGVNVFSIAE